MGRYEEGSGLPQGRLIALQSEHSSTQLFLDGMNFLDVVLGQRCVGVRWCTAHSQEAVSTIDWPSLGRPKGYGGFDAAQRAFDRNLNALASEGLPVSLHISRNSLVLF